MAIYQILLGIFLFFHGYPHCRSENATTMGNLMVADDSITEVITSTTNLSTINTNNLGVTTPSAATSIDSNNTTFDIMTTNQPTAAISTATSTLGQAETVISATSSTNVSNISGIATTSQPEVSITTSSSSPINITSVTDIISSPGFNTTFATISTNVHSIAITNQTEINTPILTSSTYVNNTDTVSIIATTDSPEVNASYATASLNVNNNVSVVATNNPLEINATTATSSTNANNTAFSIATISQPEVNASYATASPIVNNNASVVATTNPPEVNATTATSSTIVNNTAFSIATISQPEVNASYATASPNVNNNASVVATTNPPEVNATTATSSTIVNNTAFSIATISQPEVNASYATASPNVNNNASVVATTNPPEVNATTATSSTIVNNTAFSIATISQPEVNASYTTASPNVNNNASVVATTNPPEVNATTATSSTNANNTASAIATISQPEVNASYATASPNVNNNASVAATTNPPEVNATTTASSTNVNITASAIVITSQPEVNASYATVSPNVNNNASVVATTSLSGVNATTQNSSTTANNTAFSIATTSQLEVNTTATIPVNVNMTTSGITNTQETSFTHTNAVVNITEMPTTTKSSITPGEVWCYSNTYPTEDKDLLFPATLAGTFVSSTETCSNGRPMGTRICGEGGVWKAPKIFDCQQSVSSVLESLKNETVAEATQSVYTLTLTSVSKTEVNEITNLLSNQVDAANKTTKEEIGLAFGVYENIVNKTSPSVTETSNLVNLLVKYAFKQDISQNQTSTIALPMITSYLVALPESSTRSNLSIDATSISNSPEAAVQSISIPSSAFPATGDVRLLVFFIGSTKGFPDSSPDLQGSLTGEIVSLTIGTSSGPQSTSGLSVPIRIAWNLTDGINEAKSTLGLQDNSVSRVDPKCVYLDENSHSFSQSGLQTSSDAESGLTNCLAYHTTSFAIFTKISLQTFSPSLIAKIGCGFAIAGLAIVVIVYISFKSLRADPMGHMIFQLCLTSMVSFALFLAASFTWNTLSRKYCLVIASLQHFFLLLSFVWMASVSIIAQLNISRPLKWILFYQQCEQESRNKAMAKWSITIYSITLVVCAVTVGWSVGVYETFTTNAEGIAVVDQDAYADRESCLLMGPSLYYGFGLPAGLCVLISLIQVTCAIVDVTTYKAKTEANFLGYFTYYKEAKSLVENMMIFLAFLFVIWLTGCFRMHSNALTPSYYQYIDIAFGVLTLIFGIVVVLLFCVRAEHVRGLMYRCIRDCCTNSSRYYLPHTDEQGVYHDEFTLSNGRPSRVAIELTAVSGREENANLNKMSSSSSPMNATTSPPIKPGDRIYDTSADVAKTDIELTKGRVGLVGYKRNGDIGDKFLE